MNVTKHAKSATGITEARKDRGKRQTEKGGGWRKGERERKRQTNKTITTEEHMVETEMNTQLQHS